MSKLFLLCPIYLLNYRMIHSRAAGEWPPVWSRSHLFLFFRSVGFQTFFGIENNGPVSLELVRGKDESPPRADSFRTKQFILTFIPFSRLRFLPSYTSFVCIYFFFSLAENRRENFLH